MFVSNQFYKNIKEYKRIKMNAEVLSHIHTRVHTCAHVDTEMCTGKQILVHCGYLKCTLLLPSSMIGTVKTKIDPIILH